MSDFWTIYEDGIRERFQLENTLANSDAYREFINFEILVGRVLLRPRPPTIKVENLIPDAKNNEPEIKKQHFCKKCNEEFKTKFTHIIDKHRNDCPHCPMIVTALPNLRRHIRQQHEPLYKDYLTARLKMRTEVQAAENLKKTYIKLGSDELMDNTAKLYCCKICKKSYNRSSDVLRHTREFHESQKYKCKLCEFQTSRSYKLRIHEEKTHLN